MKINIKAALIILSLLGAGCATSQDNSNYPSVGHIVYQTLPCWITGHNWSGLPPSMGGGWECAKCGKRLTNRGTHPRGGAS